MQVSSFSNGPANCLGMPHSCVPWVFCKCARMAEVLPYKKYGCPVDLLSLYTVVSRGFKQLRTASDMQRMIPSGLTSSKKSCPDSDSGGRWLRPRVSNKRQGYH